VKLFSILLAVYVLALSMVPCTDGLEHIHEHAKAQIEQGNHSDHNHPEHKDHCTPFCTCACCGTVMVLPSVFQIEISNVEVYSLKQFYYSAQYTFDFNAGVWHPPALS
jgi:hypothetical protein